MILIQKTKYLIENKHLLNKKITRSVLNKGKIFGILSVLISLILFIVFDYNIQGGGNLFINLLLTFYSAVISIFPLIIGILFLKIKASENWASASIGISSISSIGVGIYAILSDSFFVWYPIIISIVLSSIIYTIGVLKRRRISHATKF